MSSVEYLREFVNERLTAAALEIFGVFTTTIVKYEEEIDRQRKLLDIVLKPDLKLRRIAPPELPQQHVCKVEVLAEQQLCIQERNSSLDPEDPESPQSKEELCTSQEGGLLVLKQEPDTFMWCPTYGESDHSELNSESVFNMPVISSVVSEAHNDNQLLSHNSHKAKSHDQEGGKQEDSGSTRDTEQKSQKIHDESKSHTNNHRRTRRGKKSFKCDTCRKVFKYNSKLLRHPMASHACEKPLDREDRKDREDQEPLQNIEELCTSQEGEQLVLKPETDTFMLTSTHEESDHSEDQTLHFNPDDNQSAEEESLINMPVISSVVSEAQSDNQLVVYNSHETESQDQKGDKHGDAGDAEQKSQKRHHKRNRHNNNVYNSKSAVYCNDHAGKKVFQCDTYGKDFKHKSKLQRHLRKHTGKKPYSCNTCGKRYSDASILNAHIRIHSAEKPHSCKTCGRHFRFNSWLLVHMRRAHPDEKPYSCKTCGTGFKWSSCLTLHMRTHSGEKPYSCNTCGRNFGRNSGLLVHVRRAHTGEKP